MAQVQNGTDVKTPGDTFTSTELNDIVNDLNANATDAENRLSAIELANRVVVSQASDLAGTLDSTVEYFIDGSVDMGSQSIEVPSGGLTLAGYSLEKSILTSSENSYTMFTSPVGGSGDVFFKDIQLTTSGTSSKVFDLVADAGLSPGPAIEITRVNFTNCSDLGVIDSYRQGLETGTGRFLGRPTLLMKGSWSGGYRCTTSIARVMFGLTTGHLFTADTDLVMSSRFLTDINADFPTGTGGLIDLSGVTVSTAFPNPSTLQIRGAILTRNGAFSPGDADLVVGVDEDNLASAWSDNAGLSNTYEGASMSIADPADEVSSGVLTIDTYTAVTGTFTAADLVHFDSPTNGRLRHLGQIPNQYKITAHLQIEGPPNSEIAVRVRHYDDSAATTTTVVEQQREVFSLNGSSDYAIIHGESFVTLDQNDYIFLQFKNISDTGALTLSSSSYVLIEAR